MSIPSTAPDSAVAPTNYRIRVALVDDHNVLRAGARRILEDEPDIEVVGEAGDGAEALDLIDHFAPDVVALDIGMPGMDGVRTCQVLREREHAPRILVLTGQDKEVYVRALRELGVHGYLLKSAGPEELIAAIRAVYAGQTVFSSSIAQYMDDAHAGAEPRLTRKEREILAAIAQGLKNQEIAQEQSISLNTVEFHMRNLFAKLGASSRADALVRAQRLGWIVLPDVSE